MLSYEKLILDGGIIRPLEQHCTVTFPDPVAAWVSFCSQEHCLDRISLHKKEQQRAIVNIRSRESQLWSQQGPYSTRALNKMGAVCVCTKNPACQAILSGPLATQLAPASCGGTRLLQNSGTLGPNGHGCQQHGGRGEGE